MVGDMVGNMVGDMVGFQRGRAKNYVYCPVIRNAISLVHGAFILCFYYYILEKYGDVERVHHLCQFFPSGSGLSCACSLAAAPPVGVPGARGWHPKSPAPPPGGFEALPSSSWSSSRGGVDRGSEARGEVHFPTLTVGLIVDASFAGRLVDKGPPAEDGPAARRFRQFWGDKSELRR